MYSEPVVKTPPLRALGKIGFMAGITALAGWGANRFGIAPTLLPIVAVCTFVSVICTTLFFPTHRVATAFLGVAVLIGTHAMTLHGMLRSTELNIILFLIGMMIIVGALKDLGFLTWIIQSIINKKKMTGTTFTIILCALSALLSSLIGEISSIVVVLALVFQVCDTLKVRATPFVLIAVLCTNIGSAATMLGNPVGIFIGNRAGFTFSQFVLGAVPIALASLLATMAVVLVWYRKSIAEVSLKMEEHRKIHQGLGPLVRIPHRRGFFVLMTTVLIIAFHHQIENILGLTGAENTNAFLIITPLIIAGLLMVYRPQRARHYVEHEVEWWTLLFFMLLFAVAGGLQEQGVTNNLADKLAEFTTGGPKALVPFVIGITSVGSAFVDNIVFVAAFNPVIQSLMEHASDYSVLWWALLFGACFGGNITVVGSTANIVALGLLEKRGHAHIAFFEWLKIGLFIGVLTGAITWGMLNVMEMPRPLYAPSPVKAVTAHGAPLAPSQAQ
ncbi:MAG TPA: SLC13 family permease [Kiritimatiellia bacterium]|nr:SLC13 family permease [Kiritimatiellia bacterium]HPS08519.1 SLC13 family permease [Kiritimatiellia bacterium]